MATSRRFVSTGRLPTQRRVQALVEEAYQCFKDNDEGENALHYPALTRVPRHLFGLCVVDVAGRSYVAGDIDDPFTIMSVAKPFSLALVCQAIGAGEVRAKVGLNATGLAFNSVMAIELAVMAATLADGGVNPVTRVRVVDPITCQQTLTILAAAGNSVRGQLAARFLSEQLGMNLFASKPEQAAQR